MFRRHAFIVRDAPPQYKHRTLYSYLDLRQRLSSKIDGPLLIARRSTRFAEHNELFPFEMSSPSRETTKGRKKEGEKSRTLFSRGDYTVATIKDDYSRIARNLNFPRDHFAAGLSIVREIRPSSLVLGLLTIDFYYHRIDFQVSPPLGPCRDSESPDYPSAANYTRKGCVGHFASNHPGKRRCNYLSVSLDAFS